MIPSASSEFAAQQSPTVAVMLAPKMLSIAHSAVAGGAEAGSSGLDERMLRAAGAHGAADGGAAAASSGDISGPEERLAFALSDGRVGVLAVKGRKVCHQTSSGLTQPLERSVPDVKHSVYRSGRPLHIFSAAARGACPYLLFSL